MKLRNVGLVAVALIAVAGACKQAEDRDRSGATSVTQGSSGDPWATPKPKKDPLPRPLLWKLERDGKTSFAFGTMHMGVDPETRLPDIVWNKLDQMPTFAMETDVSAASKLDIRRSDGKTLEDDLGPVYWKKLEA